MKKQVEHIYCDRCDKPHEILPGEAVSICTSIGRQSDGYSGTESISLRYDMCAKSAASLITQMLHDLGGEKEIREFAKTNMRKARID